MAETIECPKLRPVEQVMIEEDDRVLVLRDPAGIAEGFLSLSGPALYIASLMDGSHSRLDIQAAFMRQFGEMLLSENLDQIIKVLDDAYFLDSPRLQAHREGLRHEYRASSIRRLRDAASLAPDNSDLIVYLDQIVNAIPPSSGRVAGIIAPHLDYPRGAPCYASAYRDLAARTDAQRFVVLGTNHFGEATAVAGTRKDFETPWGVVRHDSGFMRELDSRCGADLCEFELDHVREHSVELQVVLLKRVLGDRPFTIVPYLCPDICGPTGTQPRDAHGVDLQKFATELRELVASDPVPTCIIAGADLSHIGAFFGDQRPLDDLYLASVRASDGEVLAAIESDDPESFRTLVAGNGNATMICSVGCIYAIATALHGVAHPRLRRYHQAFTPEIQNCVTCASIDFLL